MKGLKTFFNGSAIINVSLVDSFPPLPGSSKVIENYLSNEIRVDTVDPEGWLMADGYVTGTAKNL